MKRATFGSNFMWNMHRIAPQEGGRKGTWEAHVEGEESMYENVNGRHKWADMQRRIERGRRWVGKGGGVQFQNGEKGY